MAKAAMDPRLKRYIIVLWCVTAVAAVVLGGTLLMMRSMAASAPPPVTMVNGSLMAVGAPQSSALPVLFEAPSFALTDQNGQPFNADRLRGQVWVADFVFTHCAGICPMMTKHLADFQKATVGSPVQMVSFSVDPERDTPAVLKQYAAEAKADESRWHFLTGATRQQLWAIAKGMNLAVGQDTGDQVMHSNHFLLVDGQGKVRGVYNSEDDTFLPKLIADANKLVDQK
jgi:protein SCO1/2